MSSGCRAGSADRPEEPILPASSPLLLLLLCTRATDRKLIGQLLCLPDLRLAYWPVLVSPPRPQSPILSQYESMLQTWPVTNPASPPQTPLYRLLATWHVPHYSLLHGWAAQLAEIYTICMRMSIQSTFPPGSPMPAIPAPPLFLAPGSSHLNPSHFQLSPGAEPQSSSPAQAPAEF